MVIIWSLCPLVHCSMHWILTLYTVQNIHALNKFCSRQNSYTFDDVCT